MVLVAAGGSSLLNKPVCVADAYIISIFSYE